MTRSEGANLQELIGELDQIMDEANVRRDFPQALERLNRWKDRATAKAGSEFSQNAASDLSNAGNFHIVSSGDFTTLAKEAERHRRVLSRLMEGALTLVSRADFAVISIREDEAKAVLKRLGTWRLIRGKNRRYSLGQIKTEDGSISIAAVRTPEQGQLAAQDTARDAIEDLHPKWLAVVGICGAVPDSEFTLGDVVVASRLHAFTLGAYKQGSSQEFSDQGGAMSKKVQDLVVSLTSLEPKLVGWNTKKSVGAGRPIVNLGDKKNFYGNGETREETKKTLSHHFRGAGVRKLPIVTTREVASSDFLVKDTSIIEIWKKSARHLAAVEMELAGIYTAARRMEREYPILAVRGISDIVGFKRDAKWTNYACETAAAFFFALLAVLPKDYL